MAVAVWLLLYAVLILKTGSQVIEFTGTSVIPIGQNGTVTCTTTNVSYPAWQLRNSLSVYPQHSGHDEDGISIPELDLPNEDGTITSTVTITGRSELNNTIVKCVSYTSCCTVEFDNGFNYTVRVLDLPPPPTNIEAIQYGAELFLLSWSPSFSPYSVPVTYQIKIGSEVNTTEVTSHVIIHEVESCSPFQVNVSSINAAGQSNYIPTSISPILLRSPEEVSHSLQHEIQVVDEGDEMLLNISFMPMLCSYYQNTSNYSIIMTDSSSKEQVVLYPDLVNTNTKNEVHLSIYLPGNSIFNYTIQLFEDIIISESHVIYTTDVQESNIQVDYGQNKVRANCIFVPGSRAMGCVLVLGDNKRLFIDRESRDDSYDLELLGSSTFSLFDWEEDGSVGNISVPVNIISIGPTASVTSEGIQTRGPDTSEGIQPMPNFPLHLPFIVALVCIIFVVLLIIILAVIVILCLKKVRGQTQTNVDGSNQDTKDAGVAGVAGSNGGTKVAGETKVPGSKGGTKVAGGQTVAGSNEPFSTMDRGKMSDFDKLPYKRSDHVAPSYSSVDAGTGGIYDSLCDCPQYDRLQNSRHSQQSLQRTTFRLSLSPSSLPPTSPPPIPPPPPTSPPPTSPPHMPPSPFPLSPPPPCAPYSHLSSTASEEQYAELSTGNTELYARINECPLYQVLENPNSEVTPPTYSEVVVPMPDTPSPSSPPPPPSSSPPPSSPPPPPPSHPSSSPPPPPPSHSPPPHYNRSSRILSQPASFFPLYSVVQKKPRATVHVN